MGHDALKETGKSIALKGEERSSLHVHNVIFFNCTGPFIHSSLGNCAYKSCI